MALPVITARNVKQALSQNVEADGNPTTIGSTTTITIYTCPAAKSCVVDDLQVRFTGLGANTSLFVNAKLRRLREDTTGTETSMVQSAGQGILLTAGDTVTLTGNNAGDNGSAFFVFSGTELPA